MPQSGADLASQPTISRLENAPSARACYRMAEALFDLYLTEREKGGAPKKVLLDFDSTADPTHGDQEGSFYHGYYKQHIYHPLLVFDGQTGHLICALLRAGNTHGGNSTVALLKRVVARLRRRWIKVEIELRADAGFAVPALYDYCEKEGITYTVGLITNPRLKELAEDLLDEAKRRYGNQREKVKLFSEGAYEAGSWEHARRVVYKAEVMEQGTNTRFVVSTRNDGPKDLYEFYVRRGESEMSNPQCYRKRWEVSLLVASVALLLPRAEFIVTTSGGRCIRRATLVAGAVARPPLRRPTRSTAQNAYGPGEPLASRA